MILRTHRGEPRCTGTLTPLTCTVDHNEPLQEHPGAEAFTLSLEFLKLDPCLPGQRVTTPAGGAFLVTGDGQEALVLARALLWLHRAKQHRCKTPERGAGHPRREFLEAPGSWRDQHLHFLLPHL